MSYFDDNEESFYGWDLDEDEIEYQDTIKEEFIKTKYVVALSGIGDVMLYKTNTKHLMSLLEELESKGFIFMVINDKYIKDDILCLNIYEVYEGEDNE